MANNYLLLFSLSPVQSFIAQARKTQDLFGGSKLLSDLVREATLEVGKGNLLYPNPDNESLPNRFVARLEGKTAAEIKQIGDSIKNRIKNTWKEKAQEVLDERRVSKPDGFDDQVDDFWEVYWGAVPYTENSYAAAFDQLNALMGAIKTAKPTTQYDYQVVEHQAIVGEMGRKCSIDGERNVKFYRQSEAQFRKGIDEAGIRNKSLFANDNEIFPYSPNELPLKFLQPGEGLSSVSFIKRCYETKRGNSFESTADIALMRAVQFLESDTVGKIRLQEYKNAFSEFNGQLLYEENITEKYLKKKGISRTNGYELKELQKIRREELEQYAKGKSDEKDKGYRFTKYYSVIVFDGDEMGKWMSGKYLNEAKQLPDFHQALSYKLSEFAKSAKNILEGGEGKGCTVYAGGDDFLGLVNLNYLFPVLAELRTSFDTEVNQPLKDKFGFAKDLTFSAGIAIAHYKTPLNIVLDRARKMEEKAKEETGRDAFAIAVMKHSGESHEIGFNWKPGRVFKFEEDGKAYSTNAGYLQFLCEQLRDNFSRKFLKNIDKEFHQFHATFLDKNKEMFNVELKRLLKRSCLPKDKLKKAKKAEVKDKQIEKTAEALSMLYTGKEAFLQTLHLLDFVHRQLDSNA
jgi:CRISPR-associated protein Cmr2